MEQRSGIDFIYYFETNDVPDKVTGDPSSSYACSGFK
jgi:hypothetical protein